MSSIFLKLVLVFLAIFLPMESNCCEIVGTEQSLDFVNFCAKQITTGNHSSVLEFAAEYGHQFQDIAEQIVEVAFNKDESIKPILEFVQLLGNANLDFYVYEPLIQQMSSHGVLHGHNDAVLLAVAMHQTMQKPSFAILPEKAKRQLALLKTKLPVNVQNIVAPRLRIKTSDNEYLVTDIFRPFIELRRNVFVGKSKMYIYDHFMWTIGTPKVHRKGFSLMNEWRDLMYSSAFFFKQGARERRVLTWIPRYADTDSEWTIEPVGESSKFLIKNVLREECLCVQADGVMQRQYRPVSTSRKCGGFCEWEFEAAEQIFSRSFISGKTNYTYVA
jgi:hypothetical protein